MTRCFESEAVDTLGFRLRAPMHWCVFDTDFEGHRDCRTTNPPRRFTWEDPDDVVVAEDVLREAGLHGAADRLRDAAEHRRAGGLIGVDRSPYTWNEDFTERRLNGAWAPSSDEDE